jgi:long-chain acyl-CoA synthetase
MNLYDLLARTATRQPDAPALIGPGSAIDAVPPVVSYLGLLRRIDQAAERLAGAGVGPGWCVGLMVPSGVAYVVLSYAIWKRGGCIVPIAKELPETERRRILDEISIQALVAEPHGGTGLPAAGCGESHDLGEGACVVALTPSRAHPPGFNAIDAAFIRFTSGTTGTSKGVVLSHATVSERILAANEVLSIGPQDAVLWLLSMAYHFTVSIVSYLTFGAAIIQCRNHFGQTIARAAAEGGATIIYGSPVHFEFLAGQGTVRTLPRLRLALSTTASLREDISTSFLKRFGVPLGQAYGIIELGLPCLNPRPDPAHAGTVGQVLPSFRLDRCAVGWGDGLMRLRFQGPGMFDAYYHPWRVRAEVLDQGWFETGDLGSIDEDGYVSLQGRASEVINVGGMKFFPQEVEAVLERHPAVLEARVTAAHDRSLGELPHARVVLRPGAEVSAADLTACCRRELAGYQVPVAIDFVTALPTTTSGKRIRIPPVHAHSSG